MPVIIRILTRNESRGPVMIQRYLSLPHLLLTVAMLFTGQVAIPAHADQPPASIRLNPLEKNPESLETRYVFDVVVHHPEEMSKLLQRVEQLAETIEPGDADPQLALVLHGPEIAFFNTQN